MKAIIILIILLYSETPEKEAETASKIESNLKVNRIENERSYQRNYDRTIDFIKQHEGFSSVIYNDNGFKAIGYGQRLARYDEVLIEPISREKAEKVLLRSFGNHMKIVKFYYPKLTGNRLLAISHLSYCIGIGRIKQLKLLVNGHLDYRKLAKMQHPKNRMFEFELFYNR
jgi:GH24 family phage-related lysozyme (muramidase)